MLTRTAILWTVFAAIMGFAFGGCLVWSFQPTPQAHQIEHSERGANARPNEHKITKTLGERLSVIWDRTWEDPVAFYTFVLGIFTALLAVVSATQIAFLYRADQTARIAADAASLNAKASQQNVEAIIGAERPHMLVDKLVVSGIRQPPNADGKITLHIVYRFGNFGRTPAMLKAYSLIADHEKLPEKPDYAIVTPIKFIINVGGKYGSTEPAHALIEADEANKILSGEKTLMIYGLLDYADPWERPHKFRFAYRLIFGSGDASEQFYPSGPDSYWEYT